MHSILPARGYLTADYWDSFLVLPFAARAPSRRGGSRSSATPPARSRASTGTSGRDTGVDGVEIDPELTDVGYRYFDMGSNPSLTVHDDDARPWLRRADGELRPDRRRRLPPALHPVLPGDEGVLRARSRERLAPDGVVVVNVGHPEGDDEFERSLGRTMAAAFPTVLRDPAEQTNTLLIGSDGPLSADRLRRTRRASSCTATCAELARDRRGPARAAASRRQRLHRRPRPGRVAGRPLDHRRRRGPLAGP